MLLTLIVGIFDGNHIILDIITSVILWAVFAAIYPETDGQFILCEDWQLLYFQLFIT